MGKISYIKSGENLQKKEINFKKCFLSAIEALVITLLLLLGLATVLTYTNVNINFSSTAAKIAFFIGSYLSGFLAGIGTKNNGWLAGIISGLIYYILIFIFCLLFARIIHIPAVFLKLVAAMIFSIIGGITGVNLNLKKRKH